MNRESSLAISAAMFLGFVVGCSPNDNQPTALPVPAVNSSPRATLPPNAYTIEVRPESVGENSVRLNLSTNIPGTIDVKAGLSLHGQKPDDVHIGQTETVRLVAGKGTVVIRTAQLPRGTYDAEASFYPLWGFQDNSSRSTGIMEELHASTEFVLVGDGESAEEAQFRRNAQLAVMSEVIPHDPWNEKEWTSKYGDYQELRVTTLNPKIIRALYFSRLDMTIFVNTLKGDISHFRVGKANN